MSSSGSGNFPLTFQLKVLGDAEVTNKFKQVATSMQQIDPAAAKAAQSTKQVDTSLKSAGTSATQSTSGFNSLTGALKNMGTGVTGVNTGTTTLTNSFRNMNPVVNELGTGTTSLTGSLKNVGTETQSSITRNNQFSGSLQSMRTDLQSTSGQTDNFSGALGSFNKQTQVTRGGLDETNTVVKSTGGSFDSLGKKTDSTKGKMSGFAEVFRGNRGLIFSLSMVTSGAFEAQGMLSMLADSQAKQQEAQARVNELVEAGITSGKQYTDAQHELTDANRGLSFATRNTMLSVSDMIPLSIMLASSLIDVAGKGVTLTKVKEKLLGTVTKLGGALKGLPGALQAVAAGMTAVGIAGGTIAGAATALLILSTNTFGARDAFNKLMDDIEKSSGPFEGFVSHQQKGWNNIFDAINGGVQHLTGAKDQSVDTAEGMSVDAETIGLKWIDTSNIMGDSTVKIVGDQKNIQDAAEQTKDITTYSLGEQIRFLQDAEKANQDVLVSALAALQKREASESNFNNKYQQYAKARASSDDMALQRLQLTAQEEEEFNKMYVDAQAEQQEANKKKNEEIKKAEEEAKVAEQNRMFAFTASAEEQLKYLELLRTKTSEKTVTLINLMRDEQTAEAEWNQKHEQFIKGYVQGDENVRNSLAMTASEFQEHKKVWESGLKDMGTSSGKTQEQIMEDAKKRAKEFADEWKKGVDSVNASFDKFGQVGTQRLTEVGNAVRELAKARMELENTEFEDGDAEDTAFAKWAADADKVKESFGNLTRGTVEMGVQFAKFQEAGTQAIGNFAASALTGAFPTAIENIETALDATPEKWKGASGQIQQILGDTALTAQDKSNLISANMKMLENAFTPVQVGAQYVGQASAQAAAQLDELAASALSNVTNANQVDAAWVKFTSTLTPAQKNLQLVQAVMKGVESGAITASQGFQTLEAAGVKASTQLGTTVTTSLQNLEHQIIQMGNGTEATVAKMDGQWVSLGTSATTNLPPVTQNVQGVDTAITTLGTTASTELGATVPTAIGTTSTTAQTEFQLVVDYANNIMLVFKAVALSAETYLRDAIAAALTKMVASVNTAQQKWSVFSTSLASYTKSMSTNVADWGKVSITSMSNVSKNIVTTQGAASKFSTSWSSYMKSMTSAVKSFASSAVSELGKVEKAAKSAQKALESAAAAASKVKSGPSSGRLGGMHGATSIRASAASGFSGVVNRPSMIGSGLDRVKVGEDFKPELVTVTPLTRGTGNTYGGLNRASAGGGGSGGDTVIEISLVLDGQIIDRRIQRVASRGLGAQV